MTYPPQQGPYGQPQPQQYGGNPQQQGPYGYGAPPPKKSNGAVLATVMFVVVLLAGVGITGFVAPGFFLSDDSSDANGGGEGGADGDSGDNAGASDKGGNAGAKAFAEKLVAAANEQNEDALGELACTEAKPGVRQAIKEIGVTEGAELVNTREVSATEYLAVVDITYKGDSSPFTATLADAGGSWCWMDFAQGLSGDSGDSSGGDGSGGDSGDAPTSDKSDTGGGSDGSGGSSGDAADGEAAVQKFLEAVNGGNAAEAIAMFCNSTRSKGEGTVQDVVGKSPNLTIGELQAPEGKFQRAILAGTLDGKPVSSGLVSVRVEGSTAGCIVSFLIS